MSRIEPVRSFSSKEVRDIRISVNLTQIAFAAVLGVSKKTVEAWECGRKYAKRFCLPAAFYDGKRP